MKRKYLLLFIFISLMPLWSVVSSQYTKWQLVNLQPSKDVIALRSHLKDVDFVVVRGGGQCHRYKPIEKTLFTLRGAEVKELVQSIHIDSNGSNCLCCGNPTFEFYRNKKLILSLTNQHGTRLRSMGTIWKGDRMLQPASAKYLQQLLKRHGVSSN